MIVEIYLFWNVWISFWVYCDTNPEVVVERPLQAGNCHRQSFVFAFYDPGAI